MSTYKPENTHSPTLTEKPEPLKLTPAQCEFSKLLAELLVKKWQEEEIRVNQPIPDEPV
jgi:hypothetical protein